MEKQSRIEVRSFFREGGKLVGREICDSLDEAKCFAKHQLKMFPYVEIVLVSYVETNWGEEIKSQEVFLKYR